MKRPSLARVASSGLPSRAILFAGWMPKRAPRRRSGAWPQVADLTPLLVLQAQSAARAAASPRGSAGGGAGRAHARRGATRPCPRVPCRVAGRLARLASRRPADAASGGGGAADSGGAARAGARRRPGCGLGYETGQVVTSSARKKKKGEEKLEGGVRERKGSKREPKGSRTFQWQASAA